jgi:hypothetical protein
LVANHIASWPPIETFSGEYVSVRSPHRSLLVLFSNVQRRNRERSAINLRESGVHSCIAATLAQRSRIKAALVACISERRRSRSILSKRPGKRAGWGRGKYMDELIGQLASKAGIDSAVAEKTIGIVLGFLRNEGPSDQVQALIDQIPGAEAAIAATSNTSGLSRLMGGGVMAVGTRLMALGLGMGEIQNVARELFKFGRDKIGADQMGEIISGTPGLSQFA